MVGVPFSRRGDNSGTVFIHPNTTSNSIQLPAISGHCKYYVLPNDMNNFLHLDFSENLELSYELASDICDAFIDITLLCDKECPKSFRIIFKCDPCDSIEFSNWVSPFFDPLDPIFDTIDYENYVYLRLSFSTTLPIVDYVINPFHPNSDMEVVVRDSSLYFAYRKHLGNLPPLFFNPVEICFVFETGDTCCRTFDPYRPPPNLLRS